MTGKHFLENGKHLISQFAMGIDELQSDEKFRQVIPRFGIKNDGFDRTLAQARLPFHDFPHRPTFRMKFVPQNPKLWRKVAFHSRGHKISHNNQMVMYSTKKHIVLA